MNCKPLKDEGCEICDEKRLCRTFLGLKNLDEYDNTDKIEAGSLVEWDNETPIIVTATRNPLLGIELNANVALSTVPPYIMERISTWAKTTAKREMKPIVDNVGVTRTFLP